MLGGILKAFNKIFDDIFGFLVLNEKGKTIF